MYKYWCRKYNESYEIILYYSHIYYMKYVIEELNYLLMFTIFPFIPSTIVGARMGAAG